MEALSQILYGLVGASVSDKSNVSQSERMEAKQVENNAGGYVWEVGPMNRVRRFLCLGSAGGTYYAGERELTLENATHIVQLIEDGKGAEVVQEVKTFSIEGRAAKQNPIIFALALCARSKETRTKKAAYDALPEICRIPTHLFHFIEYCESLSKGTGWGRAHRRAVNQWYNRFENKPQKLAMLVTKYKNRNNWTHKDLLRLAHIKPANGEVASVIRYVVKGLDAAKELYLREDSSDEVKKVFEFLQAIESAKDVKEENEIVKLIKKHGLVREHIPTILLNSVKVWEILLQDMPMTALIRNLAKMTSIQLLTAGNEAESLVVSKLKNETSLKQARIHPFNVLVAMRTYAKGKGEKGKLSWEPLKKVQNALEFAYYGSFKFVEPTNKRFCLAVDVSGSMDCGNVNGSPSITARDAATAMMMTTHNTEMQCDVVAFSHELTPVKSFKQKQSLEEVIRIMENIPMGGTDCAQPMIWAKKTKKLYDVFVVYTDCETWFGCVHPAEALRQYRKSSGIWDTKLVVCGMTSTNFTIADPTDPGMLDMAGFDSAAPEVMRNFINGIIS